MKRHYTTPQSSTVCPAKLDEMTPKLEEIETSTKLENVDCVEQYREFDRLSMPFNNRPFKKMVLVQEHCWNKQISPGAWSRTSGLAPQRELSFVLSDIMCHQGSKISKIIFESVYSMDGTVVLIAEICDLADDQKKIHATELEHTTIVNTVKKYQTICLKTPLWKFIFITSWWRVHICNLIAQ